MRERTAKRKVGEKIYESKNGCERQGTEEGKEDHLEGMSTEKNQWTEGIVVIAWQT